MGGPSDLRRNPVGESFVTAHRGSQPEQGGADLLTDHRQRLQIAIARHKRIVRELDRGVRRNNGRRSDARLGRRSRIDGHPGNDDDERYSYLYLGHRQNVPRRIHSLR